MPWVLLESTRAAGKRVSARPSHSRSVALERPDVAGDSGRTGEAALIAHPEAVEECEPGQIRIAEPPHVGDHADHVDGPE